MGDETLLEYLASRGISRRGFMKFCATTASMLALPPYMASALAEGLGKTHRPSVIWLSFQECTGCTESLTRSFTPTLESLIFNAISLDYDETLQAAAGSAAEEAREAAMKANHGHYILVVEGAVATGEGGAYSTVAGRTNLDSLSHAAAGAAAVVCVGTCSSFGGIPYASPNPTDAVPVSEVIKDKPIVNISGCPPIPTVITSVLAHFVAFGRLPELDHLHRPRSFYGNTIHDRCYRRPFFERGKFAKTFDDEGARNGWCLFELGCKGPITYNACATTKWNQGTSFPIQSGHGCLGCSEPDFWDKGGFYRPLSTGHWGSGRVLGTAALAGVAVGAGAAAISRARQSKISEDK